MYRAAWEAGLPEVDVYASVANGRARRSKRAGIEPSPELLMPLADGRSLSSRCSRPRSDDGRCGLFMHACFLTSMFEEARWVLVRSLISGR
jgi:hypothetical protein